jgi:DNA/RNA-binding domain of Phe-tRNA-synthetase-like protein
LEYYIDRSILDAFPEVKIGVLACQDVSVEKSISALENYKNMVVLETEERLSSEPVTRHPFIASWREMYKSFGTRPGDYRPSSEALVRRVLKARVLPTINTAVDAYNAVSVRHLIPMGGFDLDKVEGSITLRLSEGGEAFLSLGASEPEETYKGEPVYADEVRILTRRWNFRDCDETKITHGTREIAMFIDGSDVVPRKNVDEALSELEAILMEHCGGEYASAVADVGNPSISL